MSYFPDGQGVMSISGKTGDIILRPSDIKSVSAATVAMIANAGADTPYGERDASSGIVTGAFMLRGGDATTQADFQRVTTAGRPAAPSIGRTVFDTTVGVLISWNGTAWVNGAGTVV